MDTKAIFKIGSNLQCNLDREKKKEYIVSSIIVRCHTIRTQIKYAKENAYVRWRSYRSASEHDLT